MNRKLVGIAGLIAIAGIAAIYTATANPATANPYGYMGYRMPMGMMSYGMMGYGMPMMGGYPGWNMPQYGYGYQSYPNGEAIDNETLPQYPQYPQSPYSYYGYGHCSMMGW
jgi:hypothetical protein